MNTFCFQPAELPELFSCLFARVPAGIKKGGLGGRQGKGRIVKQLRSV